MAKIIANVDLCKVIGIKSDFKLLGYAISGHIPQNRSIFICLVALFVSSKARIINLLELCHNLLIAYQVYELGEKPSHYCSLCWKKLSVHGTLDTWI